LTIQREYAICSVAPKSRSQGLESLVMVQTTSKIIPTIEEEDLVMEVCCSKFIRI